MESSSQSNRDNTIVSDHSPPPEPDTASTSGAGAIKPPSARSHAIRDQDTRAGAALDHETKRNVLFNIIVPLLLLGLGAGVIALLGQVQPAPRPVTRDSRAARMENLTGVSVMPMYSLNELDAELELTVDGVVVPYREVTIATEVAGKVVYKSDQCETGSVVAAGTVLMRIDPTDYQLELERLTRSREQSYQAVRESEQDRLNTKRLVEVAEDDIKLLDRELKRQKSLPKGYATAADLDRAERAVLQARQQLVTYQNQLDSQRQREASLNAALSVSETQLKTAQVNLKRTEVVAPIDGVIVREDAELNTFVARGNAIVTIEDTSKVEVASSLRMDQLYWISSQTAHGLDDGFDPELDPDGAPPFAPEDSQAGYKLPETPATIEFEVSGRDNLVYRWQGRLVGYDGIGLDAATRTVPVRILVDHPRRYVDREGKTRKSYGSTALVRGMFVKVALQVRPQVPLYVVPEKAIKPGNRLWLFQPDESVLNAASKSDATDADVGNDVANALQNVAIASKDNANDDNGTAADDDSEKAVAFDAERWIAGAVKTVEGIVPVNMLRPRFIPKPDQIRQLVATDGSLPVETKWWICELPDGSDNQDAYVVISPLGTIPVAGLPARIGKPDAANSNTASTFLPDNALSAKAISNGTER